MNASLNPPQTAKPVSRYEIAQSILGVDFITPEEVANARPGLVYSAKQVATLVETMPPVDGLEWCKENCYAVMPTSPTALSAIEIRDFRPDLFYSENGGWYADQKFASEDKTLPGWLLVKKIPVANSTSKNWEEQNNLLSKLETVPNIAEMSWFITTYSEVRGVRLFKDVYVRTSSLDSDDCRVGLGHFVAGGLLIGRYRNEDCYGSLGVSVAKKQ